MDRRQRNTLITRFEQTFVMTPLFQKVLDDLTDLIERPLKGTSTRCYFLLGPSFTGKTAVLEELARRYPPYIGPTGDKGEAAALIQPVLQVEALSECTFKGMTTTVLAALGDPGTSRSNEAQLKVRMLKLLREKQVKLLVIEEFQHLIEGRNRVHAHTAANWIKDLCASRVCPLVITGQSHVDLIVRSNPQIANRSGEGEYLDSYDWNRESERQEFCLFIYELQKAIELSVPSELHRSATALRIHHFSGGCLGRAVDLIKEAYEFALDRDSPSITHEILADAVDELRKMRGEFGRVNPFRVAELEPARPVSRYEDLQKQQEDATEALREREGR